MNPFAFARPPKIVFGSGTFADLPSLIESFGRNALVVTGGASHMIDGRWERLAGELESRSVRVHHAAVTGEPSPDRVDGIAGEFRDKKIDAVVGWGGGSVVDAGKAVSAMLRWEGSVVRFLEGVGTESHDGRKVPYIAVPTTAGTGSEATKNAVLSRVGEGGFKKSLRHDNFVPDIALVDPALTVTCPLDVTAACGLDAFTQLLEAYVSVNASPVTDALSVSGIEAAARSLEAVCGDGAGDVDARAGMAYAALMSGIVLANAGLGVVHGLASPIGGFFDIPHGVVCGTLLGAATRVTIDKLTSGGRTDPALSKYARAGRIVSGGADLDNEEACAGLVAAIDRWIETFGVKRLGAYGMREEDVDRVVNGAGTKNNPGGLGEDDIRQIVEARL